MATDFEFCDKHKRSDILEYPIGFAIGILWIFK